MLFLMALIFIISNVASLMPAPMAECKAKGKQVCLCHFTTPRDGTWRAPCFHPFFHPSLITATPIMKPYNITNEPDHFCTFLQSQSFFDLFLKSYQKFREQKRNKLYIYFPATKTSFKWNLVLSCGAFLGRKEVMPFNQLAWESFPSKQNV